MNEANPQTMAEMDKNRKSELTGGEAWPWIKSKNESAEAAGDWWHAKPSLGNNFLSKTECTVRLSFSALKDF